MRVLQYGDTSAFNMIEPYISTSIARVITQWYVSMVLGIGAMLIYAKILAKSYQTLA